MNHCLGGSGAANFGQSFVTPVSLDPQHDVVVALQRWVEEGIAPDELIATTDPQPIHASENPTNPATFTRLLCPFPEIARYKGSGDPNSAANFVCVAEEGGHDHGHDEGQGQGDERDHD
jgi:feruloyl esterase